MGRAQHKHFSGSVTKLNWECDKRLAISDIHSTADYRQYWHVGDPVDDCMLGLFQNAFVFCGRVAGFQSTSRGKLVHSGSVGPGHKSPTYSTRSTLSQHQTLILSTRLSDSSELSPQTCTHPSNHHIFFAIHPTLQRSMVLRRSLMHSFLSSRRKLLKLSN